ncbi:MAG: hypothetical protein J6M23_06520 [Bacteroidales bacterium]|nr:hypothetical protein [Bacteroidales bacterium]
MSKYTLVAWTEDGEVRMIPSLINEMSVPYREKIERIEAQWETVENEIGWLIAQSKAHEEFARFLLRVGRPREAYDEFKNAAEVCSLCSDELWLQGETCGYPALPLLHRFLAMHRECMKLVRSDRYLQGCYYGSWFDSQYLFYTNDEWETHLELKEAYETRRAWRFGRGA